MLKYLYSKRLFVGAFLAVILTVCTGFYYFKHLENERILEKERNIRLNYKQWHLPEGAKARIGTGHVSQMQYSPDGSLLAIVTDIGVWILSHQTAEPLHLLAAHTGVINSISFSPDGNTLAVGSENGTAQLWDISTGEHQKTFTKHSYFYGVDTVFFIPDGRTLAVLNSNAVLDLWDVGTGIRNKTLSTAKNDVPEDNANNIPNMYMSLGGNNNYFSSDGKTIASHSTDDTFNIWDIATRKVLRTLKVESIGKFMPFSSDLQKLAIATESQKGPRNSKIWEIYLWDVSTQTKNRISKTDDYGIPFLVFSPDGKFLASYFDKSIQIWDTRTGNEKKRLRVGKRGVSTVAFSPDNRTLVSTCYDHTLRFWDVRTGKVKKEVPGYGGFFSEVLISADRDRLIMRVYFDRNIQLWNTNTGQHESNFIVSNENVWDAVFNSDGSKLASRGFAKDTIHLWDISTGELNNLRGPRRNLSGIAFSRDGQTLASWGSSGIRRDVIQFWNMKTGEIQRSLQLSGNRKFSVPADLYFDKNIFAGIGRFYSDLFVWNLVSGDYKITKTGNKELRIARFSPDGQVLGIVHGRFSQKERGIELRDVKTGDHIRTLTGHTAQIESIAFSPDSKTLASGSGVRAPTIRLWDIETGNSKVITDPSWKERYQKFNATVASALAFSPDGKTLASGMKLGEIILWDTATGERKNSLLGHSGTISQIFFSPDGQTLISTSYDQTVLTWNLTP